MKKILISEWVPEECLKPYEGEFEFTVPSAEKHAFTYVLMFAALILAGKNNNDKIGNSQDNHMNGEMDN